MDLYFPYIFLAGMGILGLGVLVLLFVAFRQRVWWGLGILAFPPTALAFFWKYRRQSPPAIALLLVGGLTAAAPVAYVRLLPIHLGPRRKIVGEEVHLTLTGWDRNEYFVLQREPDVVVLQMANPDVNDGTLAHLAGLTRLRELDLNGTKVTDAGLPRLKTLTSLERLKLRGTGVTDAGFRTSLAPMATLRQVDLRGTRVSKEVVDAWKLGNPGRRAMQ